ncbi:DUF2946 domain-containing protein [Corticimicrobacter populi]|uniref:DUF2946 domain-containing protein n=1 Tax=Corticimicrobacter populi TaxID=2175229 RepID=A0A2V1JZQ1_9BURK|nr:DUF2946 domain-containing protein [Corticimicrobacter populi]PWF22213.1 hypothetical protein DD235_12595 [Corticimicrobacter populi]
MRAFHASRRLTAWFVCIALMLGAFAPAAMQVLSVVAPDAEWVEICTNSGNKLIRVDNAEQPQSIIQQHGTCVWCSLHADIAILPAYVVAALPAVLPNLQLPLPQADRPLRPRFIHTTFAPRGPPAQA